MLALLFVLAAAALTVLAVLLAGVVVAVVTAVVLVNALVLLVGLRARRPEVEERAPARWQPSSFRSLPEPAEPAEPRVETEGQPMPSVRAFRL
jgi:hypothetical protein